MIHLVFGVGQQNIIRGARLLADGVGIGERRAHASSEGLSSGMTTRVISDMDDLLSWRSYVRIWRVLTADSILRPHSPVSCG